MTFLDFLSDEEKEKYKDKYAKPKKKSSRKRKSSITKKTSKPVTTKPKNIRPKVKGKIKFNVEDFHAKQSTINPPLGTFCSYTTLLTEEGIRYLLVYKTSKGLYKLLISNIKSEEISSTIFRTKEEAYAAKSKYIKEKEIEESPGLTKAILDLEEITRRVIKETALIYNLLIDPELREKYSIPEIKEPEKIKDKAGRLGNLSSHIKNSIRGLDTIK